MSKKAFAALLVAGLAILPACSAREAGTGNQGGEDKPGQTDMAPHYFGDPKQEPEGTARDTLNFGGFQEPLTMDPVGSLGTGTSGGNEINAVFDTLLQYDPIKLEYQPRMAESFEFNDEGTELTLHLRKDVKFTDGTPFNAEAVIYSLKRHIGASRFGATISLASEISAPDEHTVVMKFDKPTYNILGDLTNLPGAIVSPTAAEKLGDGFGKAPVGAGPYMLEKWSPGEELILTANPDYWGEQPKTKKLRFVYLESGDTTADSLSSGAIDMMMTREPVITDRLLSESQGIIEPVSMSEILFMNTREKYPTHDVRVRKAVIHAIDNDVLNDRAYEGKAVADNSFVAEGSALAGEPSSLQYDPEAAKKLVEEAKADGWDGSIQLMCAQTAQERKTCQTLEGMLNAVGFQVTTDYNRNKTSRVWVERDFELAVTAQAVPDTDVTAQLLNNFGSESPTNIAGNASTELDAAAEELRGSRDVEAKRAAMTKVQKALDADPPMAVLAAAQTTTAWNDNVTGVVPSGAYTVFLDKVVVTD